MKSILLVLSLLSTPAAAADMPFLKAQPKAVETYSWSGLYLTGYGMYGANFTNITTQIGAASIDLGASPHGPGIGGALTLLDQMPSSPWVLGLRAEVGWANLQGAGALNAGGAAVLSVSNATNYLGAVNGLIGYTFGADQKLLAYLTGGLGFGGAKPNLQVMGVAQGLSDTSLGWDLGGGLAYALTPNWSLFIEGQYFQLGGKSVTLPGLGISSSAAFNIAVQKAGVSFKLP